MRGDIEYLLDQEAQHHRIEDAILKAIAAWIAIGTILLGLSFVVLGKP